MLDFQMILLICYSRLHYGIIGTMVSYHNCVLVTILRCVVEYFVVIFNVQRTQSQRVTMLRQQTNFMTDSIYITIRIYIQKLFDAKINLNYVKEGLVDMLTLAE